MTSVQYNNNKKGEPINTITSVQLLINETKLIKKEKKKLLKKKNNIIENIFSLNIVRLNIFPYRPDEVAMLGCESLSTTKLINCSVHREVTYTKLLYYFEIF